MDLLKWLRGDDDDYEDIFTVIEADHDVAKERLRSNRGKSGTQVEAEVTFDLDIIEQYEKGRQENND